MQYLAIDTETTGTNFQRGAKPFFVSTCKEDGTTKGWRFYVEPDSRSVTVNDSVVREITKYISGYIPVFHNAKFDIRALSSIGIFVDTTRYEDTLLASHAVSSTDEHGLKELAIKYLDYPDFDEIELHKKVLSARYRAELLEWSLGTNEKGGSEPAWDYWMPGQLDLEDHTVEDYALCDAERTILLWMVYKKLLKEEDILEGYEREKELQKVVMKVESCGLSINVSTLNKTIDFLTQEKSKEISKVDWVINKLFKRKVNLDSGIQAVKLLHGDLEMEIFARGKSGLPSVNKETLLKLYNSVGEETYERKILKHWLRSKAYTSGIRYLTSYKHIMIPRGAFGAVMYPSLNQSGTSTTRFSSSNPNGQNVGKKSKYKFGDEEVEVPKLREVFGPRSGYVWLSIDYSQIELRIFAAVSKEKSLIEALDAGYDFHGYVASRIFDKPIEEIADQERTIAKNVNFALIFGAGRDKVNRTAGIANAYELFAKQFPNARKFMDQVIRQVKNTGYIRTVDGYRLSVSLEAPYKAVNYKVQGSAGRIIKNAMIDLDKFIDWDNCKMILQIHDEIIFEIKEDSPCNSVEYFQQLMSIMENSGKLVGINTPVSCELITKDWGHGVELTLAV